MKIQPAILSLMFLAAATMGLRAEQFSYEEANQGFKTPSGNIICLSAVVMQNGKEDISIIDCRIAKVDQWSVREAPCPSAKWDKFNVFSIEHKAAKAQLLVVTNRLRLKVLIKVTVQDGIRGLRVWRL